jgi:hypothetical protein
MNCPLATHCKACPEDGAKPSAPAAAAPDYYDDEELDRFAGLPADGFDDAAVEEFRDVLTTLRPEEVSPWLRSLAGRNIHLPAPLCETARQLLQS